MLTEAEMIKGAVEKQDGEILAFLMVGQSNMAGRGDFGEVEPIENKNCVMFRMAMWQPMAEPINIDKCRKSGFASGVSLAASFADELQKYTGKKIGLIPCAHGGTKIEQWQPGEALYDNAVFTAKIALRKARLGGIIWHQGESNCHSFDYEDYKAKFLNTINGLRSELGAEELPLILGEISENIGESWELGDNPKALNALLHDIKPEIPHCAVASQEGLTLRNDGLHFNSVSCRELGKRYFEKYIELTK